MESASGDGQVVRALLPAQPLLQIDDDVVLDRRAEKHDQTRGIPLAGLERPLERREVAMRERTVGRLLYETAARADEMLRLNLEDLDVAGKRARTRSKAATRTGCSSGPRSVFSLERPGAYERLRDIAIVGTPGAAL